MQSVIDIINGACSAALIAGHHAMYKVGHNISWQISDIVDNQLVPQIRRSIEDALSQN